MKRKNGVILIPEITAKYAINNTRVTKKWDEHLKKKIPRKIQIDRNH